MAAAFVASAAAFATVSVHLVAYLTELGHPVGFAATAAGLLGVLSVTGRLLSTAGTRRFTPAAVTSAVFVFQAVAVACLPAIGRDRLGAVACVLGFGLGFGVPTIARPAMLADRYGTAAYATISGILAVPMTAAKALAPLAAAAVRNTTGSYTPVAQRRLADPGDRTAADDQRLVVRTAPALLTGEHPRPDAGAMRLPQVPVVVQAAGHPVAYRPVAPPILDEQRVGRQPRQPDAGQAVPAGLLGVPQVLLRTARPSDIQPFTSTGFLDQLGDFGQPFDRRHLPHGLCIPHPAAEHAYGVPPLRGEGRSGVIPSTCQP
jgi:hypothetical protein